MTTKEQILQAEIYKLRRALIEIDLADMRNYYSPIEMINDLKRTAHDAVGDYDVSKVNL